VHPCGHEGEGGREQRSEGGKRAGPAASARMRGREGARGGRRAGPAMSARTYYCVCADAFFIIGVDGKNSSVGKYMSAG
jgi:hypothetical protein